MAWHASDRQITRELKAECVKCSTCEHHRPMGDLDGKARNTCVKKPGMVFYTFQEHYCRQHPDVEWRLRKLEELKNK